MELTEFKSRLFDRVAAGAPLQGVLDEAAGLLGVPLHVTDGAYRLVAASRTVENPDPLWMELMTDGAFSPETVERFFTSRLPDQLAAEPGAILFEALGYPYVITPVQIGGARAASLTALVSGQEEGERLGPYLEALARFIQNALLIQDMHLACSNSRPEQFLKNLLDRKLTDPQKILRQGQVFGFGEKELYALLLVRADSPDAPQFPIRHFRSSVRSCLPRALSVLSGHSLVVLLRFSAYRDYAELDLSGVEHYLKGYEAHGCLSTPFSGLGAFCGAYESADRVLSRPEYFERAAGPVLRCEDFALHTLLEAAAAQTDLRALCHPAVLFLERCDRENGSSYVDTLYCLLTCRTRQDAQAALYIHRNTLACRVEKLESLIPIPWDDPDTLFSMALSCRILRTLAG